ncbi:hypothetical protein ScPMuIL_012356 [Solemya velum]
MSATTTRRHCHRDPSVGGIASRVRGGLLFSVSLTWILLCTVIVDCDGANYGANCSSDGNCTGYLGGACVQSSCGCESPSYVTNNNGDECIRSCGEPPSVDNAWTNINSGTYEDVVTYTCNTGYNGGTANATCQETGQWTTPGLTCTINCVVPPSVNNAGTNITSGTVGDVVTYTCNTGYSGGSAQATCEATGYWTTPALTCTIVSCGVAPPVANMGRSSTASKQYQEKVTYSCNDGYNNNGQSGERTCLDTGEWSALALTCTKLSHDESCSNGLFCDDSLGLSCVSSEGSQKCSCDDTKYWTSITCQTKPSYNGVCSDSIPCRNGVGLACTVNGRCLCSDYTEYWSGTNTSCIPIYNCCLISERVHSKTCSSDEHCRDDLGLDCNEGTCRCTGRSGEFWDTFSVPPRCQTDKDYGIACPTGLADECKNNAECLSSNVCGCSSDKFWRASTQTCETVKNYKEFCDSGQDEECKNNALCKNGLCSCKDGNFWNTVSQTCEVEGGNNSDCPNGENFACRADIGLVCRNFKCVCSSEDFWHNTDLNCQTKKDYGASCPSRQTDEECKYNLKCRMSESSDYRCDCNPFFFWRKDQNDCQEQLTYNELCYTYSSNSEILSCRGSLTQCTDYPNADKRCRCKPGYFRNTDKDECEQMSNLKVENTQITGIRETEFDVSWTGPGTTLEKFVDSYTVHWSNDADAQQANVATATTKTIMDLTPGTTYKVWVVSEESNSIPTRQYTPGEKISKQTKPGKPGLITPSSFNAPSFTLQWTASPGHVDTYSISMKELDRNNKTVNNTVSHKFKTTNTQPQVFVYSLKHGHRYDVNITAHKGELDSQPHEETIKTVSTAPGAPRNVQCGGILDTEITLSWEEPNQPNGYIESYRVVTSKYSPYTQISSDDTGSYGTTHTVEGLEAATTYKFTVAASNDLPGVGSSKEVNCTTADASSESPTNFNVGTITSRKAELSWKRPVQTHGIIQSYTVLVKTDGNKCIQRIVLKCKNCQGPNDAWKTYCEGGTVEKPEIPVTMENLINKNLTVNYTVEELDPDTHYTVLVFASNMRPGHPTNETTVHTNEEVPQVPYDVEATDVKTTSLTLRWKLNGPRPGVTMYTVSVTEVFEGKATILQPIVVNGFDNKETEITGLEEYVEYTFSVKATTGAGASISNINITKRTNPASPGKVKSLSIHRETPNNYTSIVITWRDPNPKDKNGVLNKYELTHKETGTSDITTIDIKPGDIHEDGSYSQTIEVRPEYNYTIRVLGVNLGLNGEPLTGLAEQKEYNAPAGPPPILNIGEEGLITQKKPRTTETSFSVDFPEFYLDTTNGIIRDSGLIVCKKCDENEDEAMMKKSRQRNWHEAKKEGFPSYRATNDTWTDNLKTDVSMRRRRSVKSYYFIIGEDANCAKRSEDVFCNGPLVAGSNYKVIAFVCTNGGCTYTPHFGPFVTRAVEPDPAPIAAAVGGGLGGAVVVIVVVVLVVIFIRRRRNNSGYQKTKKSVDDIEKEAEEKELLDLAKIRKERPITLANLPDKVEELHRDTNLGYAREYEDLKLLSPTAPKMSVDASLMDENKVKNRYVNILPFDHSRLKLLPVDDDPSSDYINANYIPGFKSPREYIASQGPIPGTIEDFWRMIWEQGVPIVVMLTLCKEDGKVKCEQYWPDVQGEPRQYGDLVITMESVSTVNYYEYRIFDIKLGNSSRKVRQFQFLIWKDFSADVTHRIIIDFVRHVRSQIKPPDAGKPLLIHCSAGVGRTGTYISIDTLIQFIDKHVNENGKDLDQALDIFALVLRMRQNRSFMVQTEQQYVFIHDCLKEYLENRLRELDPNPENAYTNEGFQQEVETEQLYENTMFQKTEL